MLHTPATAKAQAEEALENAALGIKRAIAAQRRALREIRQAQEAMRLGMRLHVHTQPQEAQSDEQRRQTGS
jgi:hypothetical protein